MIGIIDYGMGNLGSVENACRFLELDARIITAPEELSACSKVILPGVGAFGDCMAHLADHGFIEAIRNWVAEDRPFLGICLGLQVLFEESEESPGVEGLGILKGRVIRFQIDPQFKVPQIGWNSVKKQKTDCPLFKDIDDGSYFYLVHSFYVDPKEPEVVAGTTGYGLEYTTAVWRGNLFGTQFHPEKSHKVGLQMLRNFGAPGERAS
jgi:glutamine amidotransferase